VSIERLERNLEDAQKRADEAVSRLSTGGVEASNQFSAALEAQLEAERALAAARGEEQAVLFDLGVRWSGGAPLPHLLSSGHRTFVAFYLDEPDPDWDGTYVHVIDPTDEAPASLGVGEFMRCSAVKLGPPNDEVLRGHRLYGRGLDGYGAYVVENSRWVAELMEVNSVHDQYRAENWADARHFLFVFHDETVEAVARDVEVKMFRESMPALLVQTIDRLWPE
jgi:hypothetical protein